MGGGGEMIYFELFSELQDILVEVEVVFVLFSEDFSLDIFDIFLAAFFVFFLWERIIFNKRIVKNNRESVGEFSLS